MKQYLLIAVVLLALVGCKRQYIQELPDGNCLVRFSVANMIDITPGTKADPVGEKLLPPGTTVRVVAFKRDGVNADLTKDVWKATNTYKVIANGDLEPCRVNPDGTVNDKPLGQGEEAAAEMELNNGTYDFYAYVQAYPLGADHKTVSGIPHTSDFMVVMTNEAISRSNSTVGLEFVHKCSRIQFNVKQATDMVCDSLFADSVKLRQMAKSPVNDYILGSDITPTVGTAQDSCVFKSFTYIQSDTDPNYKKAGVKAVNIVLPKASAPFNAEFYVLMNKTRYLLKATIPAMKLEKSNSYTFTVRVKQGSVSLQLTVAPWGFGDSSTGGMGSGQTIEIGEWGTVNWGGGMGGNLDPVTGSIVIDQWTTNPEFATNVGSGQASSIDAWVAKVLNATFQP